MSLFIRKQNLRKKANLFLLSLTLSDELVGLIVIPLFIVAQMRQAELKWRSALRYGHISDIFLTLCSLLNISNLCAVIADRCYNLCSPYKYRQQMTNRKVVLIVIIIWICCSIFALSSFIFYYPSYKHDTIKRTAIAEVISLMKLLLGIMESKRKYNHILYSTSVAITAIMSQLLIIMSKVIFESRKSASQTFHRRTKRRREIKSAAILTIMFATVLVWLIPAFYYSLGKETRKNSMGIYIGRFRYPLSIL